MIGNLLCDVISPSHGHITCNISPKGNEQPKISAFWDKQQLIDSWNGSAHVATLCFNRLLPEYWQKVYVLKKCIESIGKVKNTKS